MHIYEFLFNVFLSKFTFVHVKRKILFILQIQHQYTLTDEQGPAHKKTFYVKLKLGDEEYAASGQSIKVLYQS